MQVEIREGIGSVEPEVWNQITRHQPYAGWDWCRFGEAVIGQPGCYVIVHSGGAPVAGAVFYPLRREQLPVANPLIRRALGGYLNRRPLLTCRTAPHTKHRGIFLPPDRAAAQDALNAIRGAALTIARDQRASFIVADYLAESDLDLNWGDFAPVREFMDIGTRLAIRWATFDEYVQAIRSRSANAYRDYRKHLKRAHEAGISITVEPEVRDVDGALRLYAATEAAYHSEPHPYAREILRRMGESPGAAWAAARIGNRLVGSGLLLNDTTNGVCTPVFFGRDYEVPYVYFAMHYAVIRWAIEEMRAQVVIGDTGAYEFKYHVLGFEPDPRHHLAFRAASGVVQAAAKWAVSRM